MNLATSGGRDSSPRGTSRSSSFDRTRLRHDAIRIQSMFVLLFCALTKMQRVSLRLSNATLSCSSPRVFFANPWTFGAQFMNDWWNLQIICHLIKVQLLCSCGIKQNAHSDAECDVATMVVSGSRREKTMLHCVVENTKAYEAYYAEKRKKTALNKPEVNLDTYIMFLIIRLSPNCCMQASSTVVQINLRTGLFAHICIYIYLFF